MITQTSNLNVRISPELKREFEEQARALGLNNAAYIRFLISREKQKRERSTEKD